MLNGRLPLWTLRLYFGFLIFLVLVLFFVNFVVFILCSGRLPISFLRFGAETKGVKIKD